MCHGHEGSHYGVRHRRSFYPFPRFGHTSIIFVMDGRPADMMKSCGNGPCTKPLWICAGFTPCILFAGLGLACMLLTPWFVQPAVAESAVSNPTIPASEAFISVAKAAQPAVVNIASSRKVVADAQQPPYPSPFFDDPFFRRRVPTPVSASSRTARAGTRFRRDRELRWLHRDQQPCD